MRCAIVHIDDEEEEPRKIAERLLYDGIPAFFDLNEIEDGSYEAGDSGYGTAVISWKFGDTRFSIDYIKCASEHKIEELDLDEFDSVVFIFDVHRPKDDGRGAKSFIAQSVEAAKLKVPDKDFNAVIWTHYPSSQDIVASGVSRVEKKKNVDEFVVEIMKILGFRNDV